MGAIYHSFFYEPILNLLVWLYNVIPGHDIGLAIIALTIIIKIVLLPFNIQAMRSQKALQDIQPKLEAVKEKFKDDKQKLTEETIKLYKEQKVNPMSSCLPLLIQFPFLIAVYQAFTTGLTNKELTTYSFITNPGLIDPQFIGLMDLSKASIALAILAGISQYVQTYMLISKPPEKKLPGSQDEKMLSNMNKSMQYFMPLITIVIGVQLPAGLTLYWFVTTVLTILQQKLLLKKPATKLIEIIPPTK